MPLTAAILIGIDLGLWFAWAAREDLRQRPSALTSEGSWVVLAFCALIYAPMVAYLMSFHGDWCLSYGLPSELLPPLVSWGLVLLAGSSPFFGFTLGAALLRRRLLAPLSYLAAGLLAANLLFALLTLPRLLVDGSTVQFHGGFGTRGVVGSALGHSLLAMAVVVAAASWWTAISLRRSLVRSAPPARPAHARGHQR